MKYLLFFVPIATVLTLVGVGCSDGGAPDAQREEFQDRLEEFKAEHPPERAEEFRWDGAKTSEDLEELLDKLRAEGSRRLEDEVVRREEALRRDEVYRDRRDKLGERADKLYERYEKLQDRREALIEREEKQADRFDVLLKKWEEAELPPKRVGLREAPSNAL